MSDPTLLGRSVADKMPDTNMALVVLDELLYSNWPSVEQYVARAMESRVTDWRVKPPTGILRSLQATLTDPVDILDFSESFLRRAGASEALILIISRMLKNDIELQGKTASLGAQWGLTLKEASDTGSFDLGWRG